jgi:hypothetical protein
VTGFGRVGAALDLGPGQALELAIQVLLTGFHDRDVVRSFLVDQPGGLGFDGVERVESDYGTGQIEPGQQALENSPVSFVFDPTLRCASVTAWS